MDVVSYNGMVGILVPARISIAVSKNFLVFLNHKGANQGFLSKQAKVCLVKSIRFTFTSLAVKYEILDLEIALLRGDTEDNVD